MKRPLHRQIYTGAHRGLYVPPPLAAAAEPAVPVVPPDPDDYWPFSESAPASFASNIGNMTLLPRTGTFGRSSAGHPSTYKQIQQSSSATLKWTPTVPAGAVLSGNWTLHFWHQTPSTTLAGKTYYIFHMAESSPTVNKMHCYFNGNTAKIQVYADVTGSGTWDTGGVSDLVHLVTTWYCVIIWRNGSEFGWGTGSEAGGDYTELTYTATAGLPVDAASDIISWPHTSMYQGGSTRGTCNHTIWNGTALTAGERLGLYNDGAGVTWE